MNREDIAGLLARLDRIERLLAPQLRAAEIAALPPAQMWDAAASRRDGHPLSSNPWRVGSLGWETWIENWQAAEPIQPKDKP